MRCCDRAYDEMEPLCMLVVVSLSGSDGISH